MICISLYSFTFLLFYFFTFKKNLTSTKFTGTQIQNIGIGAHCFGTPTHRNRLSVSICST